MTQTCDAGDVVLIRDGHVQFHVNTSSLGDRFTSQAFQIMTKECTNLKSVSVRGAKSWLTSEVMVNVISANPRLEKIDLTGCLALSGVTVYTVGVHCSSIKHLCLKDCVWLSVDNFLSLLCNQPNLEYLNLSGCWNLNDELVIQLVRISPSIKHLLLANLYGLTDTAVVAVAHCCPNLVHLSIKGCWRVTDSSIRLLSQYCPMLKAIQVQDCRDITEDSLDYLRKRKVLIDKAPPPANQMYRLEQHMSNVHRLNLVL
uniref:F-box/LRR-repeat protein 15-like leucin rich repeat domain-containing protein n=1 Tax=Arion vulgaris TaxID=1028688 RepID=A0A0B7AZH3_9EUPU